MHHGLGIAVFSALLCAMTPQDAATAAPADRHDLVLEPDVAARALSLSDKWTVNIREASDRISFLLSSIYPAPKILEIRCGTAKIGIKAQSVADDGGDPRWTFELDQPCPPERTLEVALKAVSTGSAPQFAVNKEGAFAGSGGEIWYPQQAYADRETGSITLRLPRGWRGWAVGVRGLSRGLTFSVTVPAKFAFAAGPYRQTTTGKTTIFAKDRLVSGTDFSRRIDSIFAILRSVFGPRPVNAFTLTEVGFSGQVAGASENGAIFAEPGKLSAAFDFAYWAHEIGHQWWGVDVRTRSGTPGAQLLTEAMAEYGALNVILEIQGNATLDAYRTELSARYAKLSGTARAPGSFLPATQEETLAGHRVATSRGALGLDCIATAAGRNRLNAILAEFAVRKRNDRASWSELEALLRKQLPDQSRLIDTWLYASLAKLPVCVAGN